VQFRGVGSPHASSSVSAIRAGLGAQTLRDVDDSQLVFTPLTMDTFSAGTTRYVRAVYTVTNNTGAALDHLTFVPVNTDPDPNASTPASTTPTVGATYFKSLTRFDGSDTSAHAADLTPITGMIYSTAQGAAITDAMPYTALDTSVLMPVAPTGLVINGRADIGWRSNASIAAGASARVTFAVAIANTDPQTDPFNFSVVVASGNDVVPVPTVTAIRPALGLDRTTVTITGTNFGQGATVKFGALVASSVTRNSSTSLTVVSPSNLPAGKVDIVVTNAAGSSAPSSADLFDQLIFNDYPVPTSESGLVGITAGLDGNLWFIENASNKIGRITTTGVVNQEYSVPTTGGPSDLLSIVTGPDNALWFTENNANRIGRITTAGTLTEFTLPVARSGPIAITVGPDSRLWFTQAAGINQISTAGTFGMNIRAGAQSQPNSITTGADGNLWSTDYSSNIIRRTTPGGETTSFTAPSAVRVGSLIAEGSITSNTDGNLWFTEPGANKIGRITPAGVVKEFKVPTPNASPMEIVSDADGDLWFTETRASKIARVTPAGVFSEFAIPTPGNSPYVIAIGPDNNIWFTDIGTNRIRMLR